MRSDHVTLLLLFLCDVGAVITCVDDADQHAIGNRLAAGSEHRLRTPSIGLSGKAVMPRYPHKT